MFSFLNGMNRFKGFMFKKYKLLKPSTYLLFCRFFIINLFILSKHSVTIEIIILVVTSQLSHKKKITLSMGLIGTGPAVTNFPQVKTQV